MIPTARLMRSDIGLSAKRGTVIREYLTCRATYNPTGGAIISLIWLCALDLLVGHNTNTLSWAILLVGFDF